MDLQRLTRARIRPARTGEDLERAAEFLGTPRVHAIAETHPEERGCVRLCEVDGELLAALLVDPTPLRIRGVEVRCARLVETAGQDGRRLFRESGEDELFGFVLEEFLGYLWARRFPVAFVHGELALYPAHGFVPCFYHPRVHVPVAAALRLPATYRVRHFKSEDAPAILELRRHHLESKPVVVASGVRMFHHFCVEGKERELRGYFSLEVNAESVWQPRFYAPEVEALDRAAACTLLEHCARKAQAAGLDEMHFPLAASHPVARLCLELGGRAILRAASADPLLDEEMLLLGDPIGLVEALAPALEPGLHALREPVAIPVRTGKAGWWIRLAPGKVSVASMEGDPDESARIPDWAFTQLLAGYRGVDELPAEIDPAHAALLAAVFPKTWPYSMSDPDHWEDVKPPRPYKPRGAEVARRVRLPWASLG